MMSTDAREFEQAIQSTVSMIASPETKSDQRPY